MIRLTIILLILGLPLHQGVDKEHRETISKTYSFDSSGDQNVLILKNIFGSVLVEGTRIDQISVNVEKIIRAPLEKDLQEGIRDITLGEVETGDSIILFTDSPYATLKRKNGKVSYQWNNDAGKADYEFSFEYAVKVPYGTLVYVSTVNDGDVKVIDTRASVRAENVNGPVYLEKISAVTRASTVNGVLECEITEKPREDCSFSTINGDIEISFPSDLSADVSYEAMHGEFYTDFDFEILQASVERTTESSKSSTTYKIDKYPKFRIGNGDVNMQFKTINGDMVLRKTN